MGSIMTTRFAPTTALAQSVISPHGASSVDPWMEGSFVRCCFGRYERLVNSDGGSPRRAQVMSGIRFATSRLMSVVICVAAS